MEMVEELQNHPKISTNQTNLYEIVEEREEDRISGLPDNLLVEILSRLPTTKEAIRTGTLSKRWKNVWTSVPSLYLYYDRKMSDFVSCVDKTLTQCRHLKLEKFVMYTSYDAQFESQINNWIRHAMNCNVEQLNFHLSNVEFKFVFDQSFFINTSFTHLRLRGCLFNPISAIRWKNLRKLFISHGKLDESSIKSILSGSPVLQTLVLVCCLGFNRLDITSESVKELEFIGYNNLKHYDEDPTDVIEINAPDIQSLTIHGDLLVEKLLLINVSSLVEANLSFEKPAWNLAEEEEILKGLLLNLLHVNEVKLGFSSSYILSRLEAKGFIVPSNVKLPDVSSYSDDDDWLEAGNLLL